MAHLSMVGENCIYKFCILFAIGRAGNQLTRALSTPAQLLSQKIN